MKIKQKLLLSILTLLGIITFASNSFGAWDSIKLPGEIIISDDWNDLVKNVKTWLRGNLNETGSDVYLGTSGNVGIGTQSPSSKLEVIGDIELSAIKDNSGNNFFNGGCGDNEHVSGIGSNGTISCGTNSGDIAFVSAGEGLTGGGESGALILSHDDTSSQSSSTNTGNTFIQNIVLDSFGHITQIINKTLSDEDPVNEYPQAGDNIIVSSGTTVSLDDEIDIDTFRLTPISGLTCDNSFEGRTYYNDDNDTMYGCISGEWIPLDRVESRGDDPTNLYEGRMWLRTDCDANEGQSCNTSACTVGITQCDGSCYGSDPVQDGTSCGDLFVCEAGVCVSDCNTSQGESCDISACVAGTVQCDGSCYDAINKPNGEVCGTGLTCNTGECCDEDLGDVCEISACVTGLITCDGSCENPTNRPNGTTGTCPNGQECLNGGCVASCEELCECASNTLIGEQCTGNCGGLCNGTATEPNVWVHPAYSPLGSLHGGLYEYQYAGVGCPTGWSVPTKAQWETARDAAGGYQELGAALQDEINKYGYINTDGVSASFSYGDAYTNYWTSDYKWVIYWGVNNALVNYSSYSREYLFSVRCMTTGSSNWNTVDPTCNIPNITIGGIKFAGCNSTLGLCGNCN